MLDQKILEKIKTTVNKTTAKAWSADCNKFEHCLNLIGISPKDQNAKFYVSLLWRRFDDFIWNYHYALLQCGD